MTMNAGIDFGTSSCSIGIWENHQPRLLRLEKNSISMASALYTSRSNVKVETIDEALLRQRVLAAKRSQSAQAITAKDEGLLFRLLTDNELENQERGLMRRELAERARSAFEAQSIDNSLYSDSEIVFGEEAIANHLEDPLSGYFLKSPKSFLGAEIGRPHINLFTEIITRMLAHIKARAESQIEGDIHQAVLGIPVNFHGTRGEEGNQQAISILERAALAAGFESVEFLYEPIAAALDFERGLNRDLIALVLDTGGGTTDCSVVRVGPSYREKSVRDESVLGYSGTRVGGTDLDIKLAMSTFMPLFGKDSLLKSGLTVPSSIFWNAMSINDVNAQSEFYAKRMRHEIAQLVQQAEDSEKVARLQALYEGRNSYQVNRSAELAKIQLSEQALANIPLDYIEAKLAVAISQDDLRSAIDRELTVFVALMKEATHQAQVAPDVIYVTGGTAKSPIVQQCIQTHFQGTEIIVGDLFGSVASGLTTWAHRIFG